MPVPLARPLALAALLVASPALAQDSAGAGAQADPAAGADSAVGEVYLASSHGDWQLRCVRAEDGADPCQMHQILVNPEGQPMAEVTLFNLPVPGEAVAGATIITPLETLLSQNLAIQVVGGAPKRYPFTFCFATPMQAPDGGPLLNANGVPELDSGCVARVGFTTEEVEAFRKGSRAEVTVFAVGANQPFNATMSLTGFTAAYAAMEAANARTPAAEGQ